MYSCLYSLSTIYQWDLFINEKSFFMLYYIMRTVSSVSSPCKWNILIGRSRPVKTSYACRPVPLHNGRILYANKTKKLINLCNFDGNRPEILMQFIYIIYVTLWSVAAVPSVPNNVRLLNIIRPPRNFISRPFSHLRLYNITS